MMRIGKSRCKCQRCGNVFPLEWETESIQNNDYDTYEETEYKCIAITNCRACGNEIVARMSVFEYPVGTLEMISPLYIDAYVAEIEMPTVHFYDL